MDDLSSDDSNSGVIIEKINSAQDGNKEFEEELTQVADMSEEEAMRKYGNDLIRSSKEETSNENLAELVSILKDADNPKENSKSSNVIINTPLSTLVDDTVDIREFIESKKHERYRQALILVSIFIDNYNIDSDEILPDIKKYIYFFYPQEREEQRGMKHIGVLLQNNNLYNENEWINIAGKIIDRYYESRNSKNPLTMKDIFIDIKLMVTPKMMYELSNYPYGFTDDQIKYYNDSNNSIPLTISKTSQQSTVSPLTDNSGGYTKLTGNKRDLSSPSSLGSSDITMLEEENPKHEYIDQIFDNENLPLSKEEDKLLKLNKQLNNAESIDRANKLQNQIDNQEHIVKSMRIQDKSLEAREEGSKKESQEESYYTANDRSLLDEDIETYYTHRQLKLNELINNLNNLKKLETQEMSSEQSSELQKEITKLDSDIRLLQQSLHSPGSEPSPPSWYVQPGVDVSQNHDQLYEIKKRIDELRDLLRNELNENTRQSYYTEIKTLEEARNEIFDNYLISQHSEHSINGGKKTKKLRSTKKKRRNKRKKSRKNKK